jgi:hypothetical protein
MENKQQTAVQEMIDVVQMEMNNGVEISMRVFMGMLKKAKEMEKQQIIDAWTEATAPDHEVGLSDAPYIISQVQKAEQYINKTYGGNK